MRLRNYELLSDEELTEKSLLEDKDFLTDAADFLSERTGKDYYEPDEIMDNFLEQMRIGNVNEVSMYRDLEYAQNADEKGKQRFGRLIDTFERMDTDFDTDTILDYGQGILTAPSTGVGLLTGGAGKVTTQAAITAGRQTIKEVIKQAALKPGIRAGAARAAAVEAPLAAIQEDVMQRTREETGLGRQEGAVGLAAVTGGAFGGALGAVGGYFGKKAATKAGELADTAQKTVARRKAAQLEINTREKEKLNKLNPELVKEGDELLEEMNQNTTLAATLSQETIESVATVATRLASSIERKKGQRITEAVADAIIEGKITDDQLTKVLDEHKLTRSQFSAVYVADISNAARKLGKQGELKRRLEGLAAKGSVDVDDAEILEATRKPGKFYEFLRSMDRLRLGAMTSQLATTVRNTIGGGFRLATDAMDTAFLGMADVSRGKYSVKEATRSVFNTGKYFFNQKEARVIQDMFSDEMPTEARRLFFSAASAESTAGSNTVLGKIGNALNVANTFSDGLFKRAMFASSLDRQLRKQNGKSLNEIIRNGDFNKIDPAVIKNAVEESLHFAYQQNPKLDTPLGEAGHFLIRAHRSVPFVISSAIPFPRFILNQMKFVSEHMPGFGSLMRRVNGQPVDADSFAKQMTGGTLILSAAMWRAQQDPDLKWNEMRDDRGNVIDNTAILGPMAPFMIMGDYIARAARGDPIDSIEKYIADTAEVLGTPRFKGTFGLPPIDRLQEDIADGKFKRAAGKLVGDIVGTYTIPVAVLKDINSAYERDARFIEDMDTILPASDNAAVDIFRYSMHYASKYMPHWSGVPEGQRRYSPTAGRLERVSPLEKQFFGVTRYSPKTTFQSELDRLQIERNEVYKRDPDPIRNSLNQFVTGSFLPERMNAFIISKEYQSMDDKQRADQLIKRSRKFAEGDKLRGYVDEMMQDMVGDDRHFMYRQAFREAYEELPKRRRRLLEDMWQKSDLYNGMSINESGAYHWAIENNKALGDIIE
jgi:hypothetical protein